MTRNSYDYEKGKNPNSKVILTYYEHTMIITNTSTTRPDANMK
jgi:hypothetical protein